MIRIIDENRCCGCAACVNVCAHGCISMNEDSEGFLYPKVDEAGKFTELFSEEISGN